MRSSRAVPFLILGSLALIWGYLWVPGKLGVSHSSVFVWAGMRTFPAYVLLLALLPLTGRPLRPQGAGLTALVGLLQVGGFVGFSSAALITQGAGHTGMLANTWQIWIIAVAWLVLGERLRGLQWAVVGSGLVGLILIIEPWRIQGVLGSLFALAAALCFAGGGVAAKVLRQRYAVDLLSLTAWQGLFGSLPLVLLAAAFPGNGIRWCGTFVLSLAYSIFIGTALGAALWLYVLKLIPANVAGVGNLATTVVGVLAGWLQLGEDLSLSEIAGMVLVALALGLLALGSWRVSGRERALSQSPSPAPRGSDNRGLCPQGTSSTTCPQGASSTTASTKSS